MGNPQSPGGEPLTFLQDVLGPILPLVLVLVLIVDVCGGGAGS